MPSPEQIHECVKDREGLWHVAAGPSTDEAWSRPILCGGVICLPGNGVEREPTCFSCLEVISATAS